MQELIIKTPQELPAAARRLLNYAGDRKVFAFAGEIGAGKTTFIQALCRALGSEDYVTSPTFALVNAYARAENGEMIYHLDLYRLRSLEEALDIGVEEYLDSGAYCFIEWPELIEPLLDESVVRIKISIQADSARKIIFL